MRKWISLTVVVDGISPIIVEERRACPDVLAVIRWRQTSSRRDVRVVLRCGTGVGGIDERRRRVGGRRDRRSCQRELGSFDVVDILCAVQSELFEPSQAIILRPLQRVGIHQVTAENDDILQ